MIVFTDGNTADNSDTYDTVLPTLKVVFIKELNSQSVILSLQQSSVSLKSRHAKPHIHSKYG